MSKETQRAILRNALERSGSDWIFRFWGKDSDKHLDHLTRDISAFVRAYQQRFGEKPDPFGLLKVNPTKAAAFSRWIL